MIDMEEQLLDNIKKNINEYLKPFTFNKKILDEMEDVYLKNEKYNLAILKVIVKDNQFEYVRSPNTSKRVNLMMELFKKLHDYTIKNKKKVSDCIIYLYIANVYTYEYQNLPFFVLARPKNRNGIIIPDETFIGYDVKGSILNWDEMKDIIKSHCGMERYDKINKLYYRGPNAGADKHNLRKLIEKERKLNTFYDITVGSYAIPIYESCKYKYLINLPGDQPWSARYKYFMLMKSLMIHVDLKQHFEFFENDVWITFFGPLFQDKIDNIDLIYDWYENDAEKNKKNLTKLINEIRETYTYYEDNPEQYDEIVKNAYNKVNAITLDLVYESMLLLINEYASRFKN